jgi:ferredoxin
MRVIVDQDLCQGHALCEDIAPAIFEIRDDGLAYVLVENPGEDSREVVEEAVRRCPALAISVED